MVSEDETMETKCETHLDGDDRVLLDEAVVKSGELLTGQPLGLVRVLVLEAKSPRNASASDYLELR